MRSTIFNKSFKERMKLLELCPSCGLIFYKGDDDHTIQKTKNKLGTYISVGCPLSEDQEEVFFIPSDY